MSADEQQEIGPAGVMWYWDSLRREGGERGRTYELKDVRLEGIFLVGLVDEDLPAVLVTIEPDDRIPADLSGRNVRLRGRTIQLDHRNRRVIEVSCRDRALEMPFSELVVGIHRRLLAGRSGLAAVKGAVGEFRELLERPSGQAISREQAAGMAGELLVLKWLLEHSPGAWRFWEGPGGGTWDFRAGGKAIEVKTSTRPGERDVQIHGLHQLEPPSGGLSLVHITLLPDAAGAVSVPALADELAQVVDDGESFRGRLQEGGYEADRSEAWERHRFDFTQHAIFKVDVDFPALTPSRLKEGRLPAGLASVSYSVSLDVARKWQIPAGREDEIFREVVGV